MNTNPTRKPPATVASDSEELERQIGRRAYEIYEARGREDGPRPRRLAPRRRGDHKQENSNRSRLTTHPR
jgi:hypothetical protein